MGRIRRGNRRCSIIVILRLSRKNRYRQHVEAVMLSRRMRILKCTFSCQVYLIRVIGRVSGIRSRRGRVFQEEVESLQYRRFRM